MRLSLAALVAMLASSVAGPLAAAEPAPGAVRLTWDVPSGCPTADTVIGNAERILASSGHARTSIAVVAHVSAAGPSWQASLSLDVAGNKSERRFAAESCDAIAAAASLIIAVAASDVVADGEWPAPTLEAEPSVEQAGDDDALASLSPDEEVPALPAVDAAVSVEAPAAASSPEESRLVVAASGLVGWNTMPGHPSLGLDALFGREWRPKGFIVRAFSGATYFPYRTYGDPTSDGLALDLLVAELSGRVCAGFANAGFSAGPCMGITGSLMHARGVGGVSVTTKDVVWFSFLASFSASLKLTDGLALTLRGDLQEAAANPEVHVDWFSEPVFAVPSRAFRTALGLEAIF